MADFPENSKLDLGSGQHKEVGYIGIDIVSFKETDITYDLTKFPYPAKDNSIDRLISHHTLEHFSWQDVIKVMNECYRILKPEHEFEIVVPLFPSETSVDDPDHKTMFTTETFGRFEPENEFAYEMGIVNKWKRILNDWTPQVTSEETSEGLVLKFPKRRELHVILKKE